MEEQELREHVISLSKNKGIKYNFMSQKMGMSNTTLCHFIKADRKFSNTTIKKVEMYVLENPIN